jgi:AbiV family abortive infection protein
MTVAVPPRDDLGRLAQASLRNAQDLLADARLLAGAGRFPTAHAVATLALEEAGKASLCILALLPAASVLDAEGFWHAWRDHASKLLWAASVLGVLIDEPDGPLSEVLARLTDESRAAHLRKLRGFYVDYSSRDAAVLLPSAIGADEAEAVMSDVQAALEFMMPAWGHDGILERIREIAAYEDQLVELHAGIMRRIETDPDTGLADFRNWFESQRSSAEPG